MMLLFVPLFLFSWLSLLDFVLLMELVSRCLKHDGSIIIFFIFIFFKVRTSTHFDGHKMFCLVMFTHWTGDSPRVTIQTQTLAFTQWRNIYIWPHNHLSVTATLRRRPRRLLVAPQVCWFGVFAGLTPCTCSLCTVLKCTMVRSVPQKSACLLLIF